MDPSKANPREYLRQAIDSEMEALEESVRESIRALKTLRHRHNALAPISSLPTEVIATIFSFLRLPGTSLLGSKPNHQLAWLHVTHVCHQWRKIALNQPLFWSHIDFTNLTKDGVAKLLARAKKLPLQLEARQRGWDEARFRVFEKALQTHVSHVCDLTISADSFCSTRLQKTLKGLKSPAPTLEYLSLSHSKRASVPDTLFKSTTPKLSCLELYNHTISWKSPLLKGLRSLELRTHHTYLDAQPSIEDWMDALNEMQQLRRLVLHWTSPIPPRFPFDLKRTATLPFLTHLDISDSASTCAVVLVHLVLPALTWLSITAMSYLPNRGNAQRILQCIAQHAHGPQDTQPLQSVLIRGEKMRTDIIAWTVPASDINVDVHDPQALQTATHSARVVLSITSAVPVYRTFNAVMALLPLDSLVTLTAHHGTRLDEQFWLCYAQRWPLLQRVRLAAPPARGFREMLLHQNNSGSECPPLPLLTKLDLIDDTALSERRTLRLCDALMQRVEQGVPFEALGLSNCLSTSHAVRLLSEIVVDVWGPAETTRDSAARGHFVYDSDDDSEEDDDYSNRDDEEDSTDEEEDNLEIEED